MSMTDKQRAAAKKKAVASTKSTAPRSTKHQMAGPPRLSAADRKTLERLLSQGSGSGMTDKQMAQAKKLLPKK
tara:strand:+ start:185 stop:403 length:219 start_codon:yes stop_codon:yes gene_type:complete